MKRALKFVAVALSFSGVRYVWIRYGSVLTEPDAEERYQPKKSRKWFSLDEATVRDAHARAIGIPTRSCPRAKPAWFMG